MYLIAKHKFGVEKSKYAQVIWFLGNRNKATDIIKLFTKYHFLKKEATYYKPMKNQDKKNQDKDWFNDNF